MHQRRRFIAKEEETARARSAAISFTANDQERAPGLLRLLGEAGYWGMFVVADGDSAATLSARDCDRLREARRLFPEAKIVAVHTSTVTDGTRTELIEPNLD